MSINKLEIMSHVLELWKKVKKWELDIYWNGVINTLTSLAKQAEKGLIFVLVYSKNTQTLLQEEY